MPHIAWIPSRVRLSRDLTCTLSWEQPGADLLALPCLAAIDTGTASVIDRVRIADRSCRPPCRRALFSGPSLPVSSVRSRRRLTRASGSGPRRTRWRRCDEGRRHDRETDSSDRRGCKARAPRHRRRERRLHRTRTWSGEGRHDTARRPRNLHHRTAPHSEHTAHNSALPCLLFCSLPRL